jgi:hypothetical protein
VYCSGNKTVIVTELDLEVCYYPWWRLEFFQHVQMVVEHLASPNRLPVLLIPDHDPLVVHFHLQWPVLDRELANGDKVHP